MKKLFVMVLIGLVSNLMVFAGTGKTRQDQTQKVKAKIAKLGTGSDVRVTVKLKDGRKINGYVSETKSDNFILLDFKTGNATEIKYADVKQVKRNRRPSNREGFVLAVILIALGAICANTLD